MQGKILQYNESNGAGLLIVNDGSKIEFTIQEWTDTNFSPQVGQTVAYESNNITVKENVTNRSISLESYGDRSKICVNRVK